MSQIVETEEQLEKVLFVYKDTFPLVRALHEKVKEYDMHIRKTSSVPYSFHDIDYMFVVQDEFTSGELSSIFAARTRTLLITSHEKTFKECTDLIRLNNSQTVRIVFVSLEEKDPDVIERILWFMLSSSSEASLHMGSTIEARPHKKAHPRRHFKLSRRRKIGAAIIAVILMHTFFILPLFVSGFFIYRAGILLKDQRIEHAKTNTARAQVALKLTKGAYALAHPGLQFLFLSVVPNNLISIEENGLSFIDTSIRASENTRRIAALVLNPHKDVEEVQETRQRIKDLELQVVTLETTSQNVADRLTYKFEAIEEVRSDFEEVARYLSTGSRLVAHLDSLLADNTEKNYIFFFYNNMEIRPGGGFIGSFAQVTFADYTLKSFEVFDVYDADGQLKTHVRPPAAIRDHLHQPHWFLRDSNFDPDFEKNVKTAEFFLDRELKITDLDGAVGMTTTALTYILQAFGDIYIADFDETINADNFYLKTQTQTEADYFPGSTQKKSFLSTVGRQLLLKMEEANPALLGLGIKRALDEKHLVLYTKDPDVQADIVNLGWSGKLVNPQCLNGASNCILNHILPLDANLGVNKANYFVSKLMKLKTTFQSTGKIQNELSLSFTNTAPPGISQGGRYKNYAQIYIPSNASVSGLEVNGERLEKYDVTNTGLFKVVGTLIKVDPKETVLITLSYTLAQQMKKGENTYQIVLQKQIGSFNNDFSLEINFPEEVIITHLNFKSVAKNQSVLYNSSLSTNKIFVIDFVKE